MFTKTQKMTLTQDDELGRYLYDLAARMVRDKDLRDAMDTEVNTTRTLLIDMVPSMREMLPPDGKSLMVEGRGDGDTVTKYRLTIQRTGGQEKINKVKLLELGVSPDIIKLATNKSVEGETVVVVKVAI